MEEFDLASYILDNPGATYFSLNHGIVKLVQLDYNILGDILFEDSQGLNVIVDRFGRPEYGEKALNTIYPIEFMDEIKNHLASLWSKTKR